MGWDCVKSPPFLRINGQEEKQWENYHKVIEDRMGRVFQMYNLQTMNEKQV